MCVYYVTSIIVLKPAEGTAHRAPNLGKDDSKANRCAGLYPLPVPEICEHDMNIQVP